jgi:hypothetical protein
MDYSKEQVITDILDQYERHLNFIHLHQGSAGEQRDVPGWLIREPPSGKADGGDGRLLVVKGVRMVVEATAEGGKQHGFAIDGQGIADVKPGQLLLVGFSSTTE